jgi:glycosyltransferase involved in cell wall biosynthesis
MFLDKRYRKVCLLSTVHPPFDTRIFHKQAKTLAQAGYEVVLIAQHDRDEMVDGVKIVALPKPRNRFARIFGLTWRAFHLALRERAEVYHFHDPELLPIGVLLRIFTRAKVIYDVHENVPKQILNKFWLPPWSRKPLALAYKLVERFCLPFIDVIVIAEDSYIENYRGRNNVVAIRNYPIIAPLTHGSRNMAWAEPRSGFRLVYVGGVSKLRGALELIEAMKILTTKGYKDLTLSIIGPVTPTQFGEEITLLLRQYDLEARVQIPGPIPHEEVFDVLVRSHIGLAVLHPDPNYVDSLPTKIFEYMAAGLPVVVSNFPLWKEIVEGNRCGITVDPLDPKAIAQAIEYLLTHPEEARQMGENGRRAVEEKYNWEKEAEKLLALYKELVDSAKGR